MLCLSRCREESIIVTVPSDAKAGDQIRFLVTEIVRDYKVRVAVEAPKSYGIYRNEVLAAIEREEALALKQSGL